MTNIRSRLEPNQRKQQILNAALKWAEYAGLSNITREDVARAAFVAPSTVTVYFTMEELRTAVVKMAVKVECLSVIKDGLFLGYNAAIDAPEELKNKAIVTVKGL